MLGSITPLGERGRGSHWWLTIGWFLVGSLGGGVLVGAALGSLGTVVVGGVDIEARLQVLAGVTALAVVADVTARSVTPTLRQVNAYWIGRYRGWVVGVGFGFQLGVGVATIVTTALVYAALIGAILTASTIGGATVMGAFGIARGAALLPAARITTPSALFAADAWLNHYRRAAAALTASLASAVAVCVVLVTL